MCGRFTQIHSSDAIAQSFELDDDLPLTPSYNIAPTQAIAAIRQTHDQPERHLALLHWGLLPSWAKDRAIAARLINARSETAAEKPSFRKAFRQRRCLIVADGFYEWQRQEGAKQPFYFHLPNHQPFAFAGLWEHWQADQETIESCTILTTSANDCLRPIHDRMPVILHPKDYEVWLDPEEQTVDRLQSLLQPYLASEMTSYPVSRAVNRPTHNQPDCIAPSEPAG